MWRSSPSRSISRSPSFSGLRRRVAVPRTSAFSRSSAMSSRTWRRSNVRSRGKCSGADSSANTLSNAPIAYALQKRNDSMRSPARTARSNRRVLFRVIPGDALPPPREVRFEQEQEADEEEGGRDQLDVRGLGVLPCEEGEARDENRQAEAEEPPAPPSARHGGRNRSGALRGRGHGALASPGGRWPWRGTASIARSRDSETTNPPTASSARWPDPL